MRPSDPTNPPWTPGRLRRALVFTAVIGAALLYVLGIGALLLKRQLLAGREATQTPTSALGTNTATPMPVIHIPEQTLEPTPTQGTLVFPTARPTATATPSGTLLPGETVTASPSPSTTTSPTATATVTPSPSETATEIPSETPTLTETPTETSVPTSTETATEMPTPTATPSPATTDGSGMA